ncbi:MAG: sortase [Anaerolineae bacterium]
MRFRLLESAARVTLAIAILGYALLGDPSPVQRAAMEGVTSVPPVIVGASPEPPATQPTDRATPEVPTPIPSGPPTRIKAPAIGLDAPIVEVGWHTTSIDGTDILEWDVPDDAAGYHRGSAFPGHRGNTVISGHNNMGTEVFRHLIDLNVGDEITLLVGERSFHYRVAQKELVQEQGASPEQQRENARWIAPTEDERLTLVTCWPYTGNSHRLILVAKPAPSP